MEVDGIQLMVVEVAGLQGEVVADQVLEVAVVLVGLQVVDMVLVEDQQVLLEEVEVGLQVVGMVVVEEVVELELLEMVVVVVVEEGVGEKEDSMWKINAKQQKSSVP